MRKPPKGWCLHPLRQLPARPGTLRCCRMVGTKIQGDPALIEPGQDILDAIDTVEPFIRVDRVSASAAFVLVVVAWLFGLREGNFLLYIAVSIAALVICLNVALEALEHQKVLRALSLAAVGNWIVAITVGGTVPQLWPVMIMTALLPVILATPFLDTRALVGFLVAAAVVVSLVATAGLLNDDGGVVPDLEDELELLLVIGAVIALVAPTALVVRNNNRLLQGRLASMRVLNSQLVTSRSELAESRTRVVEASDIERRRIERDLHDGAQQQLVSLGVRLRLLESTIGPDHELAPHVITLISEADEAIEELRRLAHGIYPPLLEASGLAPALQAAARRSGLSVETDLAEMDRLGTTQERALYFVALEALTNAAKYAPDSDVKLSLLRTQEGIELTVRDNGPGFDIGAQSSRHGIHNMSDRVAAVGGDLRIETSPGRGTAVIASIASETAERVEAAHQ